MNGRKKGNARWLYLSCIFILSAACIVFGILCIYGVKGGFIAKHTGVCIAIYCMTILMICLLSVLFLHQNREGALKTIVSALVLALFLLIVWYILQRTGFFTVFNDAEKLQQYLQKSGAWMPIFYIILQFLQVVILPIPSVVSTVAGVALFGAFWTSIYSFVGITLGSLLAFWIGRKWGKKAVAWMVGEESLRKWQNKIKGKDNVFLTVMFVLPLFPDDILCFLAGLSSMSWKYFLIMMPISRIVAIFSTCYSINLIPFNTWWGITIWAIILLGIVSVCIFAYKNMDKIQNFIKKHKENHQKKA